MMSDEQLFHGMSGWSAVLLNLAESGNDIREAVTKVGLAMSDEGDRLGAVFEELHALSKRVTVPLIQRGSERDWTTSPSLTTG